MEKRSEKRTKKIILTGPESTGKSWLSRYLANQYNALWIPEYARFYVENLKRDYIKNDVMHIAEKQAELESEFLLMSENVYFVDTSLIITKVWLEHVFGSSPDWIDKYLSKQKDTMYLLCYYDLPWENDPVRENKNLRSFFFDWYKKELEYYNLDYAVIKGIGNKREENAIKELNSVLYNC